MTMPVGGAPAPAPGGTGGTPAPAAKPATVAVPPVRREPVIEKKAPPGQTGAHRQDPAPAPAAPAAPKTDAKDAKPAPKPHNPDWFKKIDLKIGDETESVEFDTPEAVIDRLRRNEAQLRAWQRKADPLEKRGRALEEAAKNPREALKVINPDYDFDADAIARVNELYEAERLKNEDPGKWGIQQRDAQIAEYKRKEQERATAETRAQVQAAQQQSRQRWQAKIVEAINEVAAAEGMQENVDFKATTVLPAVAGVMFHARQENPQTLPSGETNPEYDPDLEITPREVAQRVLKLRRQEFEAGLSRAAPTRVLPMALKHFDGLDDAGFLEAIGPDRVARIVKAHLQSTDPGRVPAPTMPDPTGGTDYTAHTASDIESERKKVMSIGERKIPRF